LWQGEPVEAKDLVEAEAVRVDIEQAHLQDCQQGKLLQLLLAQEGLRRGSALMLTGQMAQTRLLSP
jgi:hypothetical protein